MATYGETVTLIISELARSDTSITDFVQRQVLSAVDFYSTQRTWFNEAHATLTTSSSLATYALPTDCLEIDSVTYTYNGTRYEIDPQNYAVMNERDPGTVFSMPCEYAMFAETLRLYPVPNRTYTIAIAYQKRLATLSASTDTNGWLTHGEELIRARAEKVICALRFRDFDGARIAEEAEIRALARLVAQTEKLLSTGRISPGY